MVAMLDRTKRPYFLLEAPGHGVLFTKDLGLFLEDEVEPCHVRNGVAVPQRPKYPWAVCPHVSDPEKLMSYYSKAGFIMILLGKCLCQECHEQILTTRNLQGFLDSCQFMSDRRLQESLIDPLLLANRRAVKPTLHHTWECCHHVADESHLKSLYRCCNPIFIHSGQVTCGECLDSPPQLGPFQSGFALMDDSLFQQKIIDRLYPLNSEMLKFIRKQPV